MRGVGEQARRGLFGRDGGDFRDFRDFRDLVDFMDLGVWLVFGGLMGWFGGGAADARADLAAGTAMGL
jgi:hypothetical protein